MPLMNFTELKDARTTRWLHKYTGGQGIEIWQFLLGPAVLIVGLTLGWMVSLVIPGLFVWIAGFVIAAAVYAPRLPNQINTHHKQPRDHVRTEARRLAQRNRPLILDDHRMALPGPEEEDYVVHVAEFPPPT